MPDGYQQHPPPASVTITLDIDADTLDWLQEQPGWRREIRDLLRFYMETSLIREAGFEESTAPEGGSEPPETLFPEGTRKGNGRSNPPNCIRSIPPVSERNGSDEKIWNALRLPAQPRPDS